MASRGRSNYYVPLFCVLGRQNTNALFQEKHGNACVETCCIMELCLGGKKVDSSEAALEDVSIRGVNQGI